MAEVSGVGGHRDVNDGTLTGRELDVEVLAGRYELLVLAGSGGEGQVWRARDRVLQRTAAIKLRPYDPDLLDESLEEARLLAGLTAHPGLPLVRNAFVDGDRCALDMDWVEGQNLADVVAERGSPGLPVEEVLSLLSEVAGALDHLHGHDPPVVHGDVKPANLILTSRGAVVLVDFGISSLVGAGGERRAGTRGYLAPEVVTGGQPSPSCDVFGLAATAVTLLTGTPPERGLARWDGIDHALVARLEAAVRRGLSFRPDERPETAGAFVATLRSVLNAAQQEVARVPLPSPLVDAARAQFVGRDVERETFLTWWREVVDGDRRVLVLSGEAGAGKSRLVAELAAAGHRSGALVLLGRCEEDSRAALHPFTELVRHVLDHGPARWFGDPVLLGHLALAFESVGRRFPAVTPATATDPDSDRQRTAEALDELLAAISVELPVLLVLDDIQWADAASVHLLRYLARSTRSAKLLVLAAHRDAEMTANVEAARLVRDLARLPQRSRQLTLSGLSRQELGGLVANLVDRAATDGFLASLEEATGGNPFFAEEVLHHLADEARLPDPGAPVRTALLDHLSAPAGVQSLLDARFEQLSPGALQLLTFSAAMGRQVDVDLVEALGGPAGDDLLDAIEELIEARFLVEAGGRLAAYVFAHDLVRRAAYDRSSRLRRTRLHWRIGEELTARRPDDLDAIAHHLFEGSGAGDPDSALRSCRAAAAEATRLGAPDRAAHHLQNAITLVDEHSLGDDEMLYALLMDLLDALRAQRDSPALAAAGERALETSIRLGSPDKIADAEYMLISFFDGSIGEHAGLLERALAAIPPGDSPARVKLLTSESYLSLALGRDRVFHDLQDEALAMARRLDTPTMRTWAIGLEESREWSSPDLEQRRSTIAKNHIAISESNDLNLLCGELLWDAAAAAGQGRRGDVLDACERLGDVARSGQPFLLGCVHQAHAALALAEGRPEEAGRLTEAAFAAAGFDQTARYSYEYQRFRVEEAAGTWDLSEPPLMGGGAFGVVSRLAVAAARCRNGDLDAGRAALEEVAADDFDALPKIYFLAATASRAAELCTVLGEKTAAIALESILRPWSGRLLVFEEMLCIEGAADRFLGMLAHTGGRYDDADQLFRRALDLENAFPAPGLAAETQYWWARTLLARDGAGDAAMGRALLKQCQETWDRTGANTSRARASKLLGEPT